MKRIITATLSAIVAISCCGGGDNMPKTLPAPVYSDPGYTGSCDPEVVWNERDSRWYMFYTGRRPARGIASTCGNPIGVASSSDMLNWNFEGYCRFDGVGGEKNSAQTFWAPGVIIDGDEAHMFVTHKPDSVAPWGTGGAIAHYKTSTNDLVDGWRSLEVTIDEDNCLDASVVKLSNGKFRLYYVGGKNNKETKGRKTIRYAESTNLSDWEIKGNVLGDVNDVSITKHGYQEGVYVFEQDGYFYMIADPHKGLTTFSSKDGVEWKYIGKILIGGTSKRTLDWSQGRHPSVVVRDGRAYIYYHVEPFRPDGARSVDIQPHQRYAFVQIAELICSPDKIEVVGRGE
ncbi:MAG: family 43 glycosylhydrolase [Rikenellaceae bacterium]